MTRTITPFVTLLASLLLCTSVATAADGWTAYGYITQLEGQNAVISGPRGMIVTTDASIVTGTCTGGTPSSYFLPDDVFGSPSNPQFKENLSLLLAAYLNGRQVALYVSGCAAPYGNPGWPKIGAIRIQ